MTRRRLRVALVMPYYDPRVDGDPAVRLARFPTVPELAAELARLGFDVRAFHLSDRNAEARWSGVEHRFVATGWVRRAAARLLWRLSPRFTAPYYEPAFGLVRRVLLSRPDIVHVFGLNMDVNVWLLARAAAYRGIPLVAHFHGGVPAVDSLTRFLQRGSLRRMSRVLFTHAAQAQPWLTAGLRPDQVGVVIETSTCIPRLPRPRRADRTLSGNPACVLVGRLHPVKDPLTALTAFALLAEAVPSARLHVFSGSDAFGRRFPALVRSVPVLAGRVVFYDYTKPRDLAAVLADADLLLQASRREWSSLSVLEALATGVVPVVTDIPALRALTNDGRVGRLVPVGDARAMADAAIALAGNRAELERLSLAGRADFDARLSFRALAREVARTYGDVVADSASSVDVPSGRRTRRPSASTSPPAA
ncbi:MAG: glycosyltransferase family 4 protein [Ardenticatenales bacterium]|nr:glycosyltransferase family 4 protein [Ardenticatenales bacterium]